MSETKTMHIWMLDGRSLCDRRPYPRYQGKSDAELEVLRKEAEAAQACGPCLLMVSRLRREAAAILEMTSAVHPEKASDAWESMRETRWAGYFNLEGFSEHADKVNETTRYDQVNDEMSRGTVLENVAIWDEEVAKSGTLRDQLGGKGSAVVS